MWSPTHIQVTVQRARNLQNKGRKDTNNAFVLIQMGKEKFQTTIKEKAADPEWYEECDLTLIGRDSDVYLTAFHRNALGLDEFLGQTAVSLTGIESFDRPFTRWYTLKGKSEKSEDKCRGELEVKIAFIVQRCSDTQSLNDLSIKKRKNSIKDLAISVGHKIQKLPSRSMSLRHLDPRKRIEKLREKRLSISSDPNSLPEGDFEDSEDVVEEFPHGSMKRHNSLYSSTLSLPQSAMITSSIQEAESLKEKTPTLKMDRNQSESNSTDSRPTHIVKPPARRNSATPLLENKTSNHGEWTNRVLVHIKESPLARSETNLMDALKSETPMVPARKTKLETLRHNLRRHTLQLPDPPDLLNLSSGERKNRMDRSSLPNSIPPEVLQQFQRMNHEDLVLLAIQQQGDLERKRDKILDLENYLDNLLVRVMETTPRILQKPYISQSCSR